MLTIEELSRPDDAIKETLEHFGVDEAEAYPCTLWDDLEKLREFTPCLCGIVDFNKKFRVIIDYDPEFKTALIRSDPLNLDRSGLPIES